jgi:hypothetical protein
MWHYRSRSLPRPGLSRKAPSIKEQLCPVSILIRRIEDQHPIHFCHVEDAIDHRSGSGSNRPPPANTFSGRLCAFLDSFDEIPSDQSARCGSIHLPIKALRTPSDLQTCSIQPSTLLHPPHRGMCLMTCAGSGEHVRR